MLKNYDKNKEKLETYFLMLGFFCDDFKDFIKATRLNAFDLDEIEGIFKARTGKGIKEFFTDIENLYKDFLIYFNSIMQDGENIEWDKEEKTERLYNGFILSFCNRLEKDVKRVMDGKPIMLDDEELNEEYC